MAAKDRDSKGRFLPGHSLKSTGRMPRERELRYYEITMNACSFEDWKAIVKKAVEQAKRGNKDARKWLGDYIVGVPEQNINAVERILVELYDPNTASDDDEENQDSTE